MSKPLLGLMLGGVLGILDGATAFLYPEAGPFIVGIVIGSTMKGLVTGVAIGFLARKLHSVPLGILFGLLIGALLSFIVASLPNNMGGHYYFQIMLPGSILGLIVGFATQRYGKQPAAANS
jgi:hypothetical protein